MSVSLSVRVKLGEHLALQPSFSQLGTIVPKLASNGDERERNSIDTLFKKMFFFYNVTEDSDLNSTYFWKVLTDVLFVATVCLLPSDYTITYSAPPHPPQLQNHVTSAPKTQSLTISPLVRNEARWSQVFIAAQYVKGEGCSIGCTSHQCIPSNINMYILISTLCL